MVLLLLLLEIQPECSVLISSLELFACNPDVATGLAKCLHILQLAPKKTVSSFKMLDAIPRVQKVACVQAHESKRPASDLCSGLEMIALSPSKESNSPEIVHRWRDCMKACTQLFAEFFAATEEAKCLVLESSTCIDCLFDLF